MHGSNRKPKRSCRSSLAGECQQAYDDSWRSWVALISKHVAKDVAREKAARGKQRGYRQR